MRIRRALITAILALAAAGAILAGSATHVTAAPAHSAHVVAATPDMYYFG